MLYILRQGDTVGSTDFGFPILGSDSNGLYAPLPIGWLDAVNDRATVEQRFSTAAISTATTTTVKSGAGFLHRINILGGTLGAVTVYDNTAASGTTICPAFTPGVAIGYEFNVSFATGLTIVTAAATVIQVSYR